MEFDTADPLLEYLEKNINVSYAIYWRGLEDKNPRHAHVFFTNDAKLIVGLSVDAETVEDATLDEMMNYCSSKIGYITYEQPPPGNAVST